MALDGLAFVWIKLFCSQCNNQSLIFHCPLIKASEQQQRAYEIIDKFGHLLCDNPDLHSTYILFKDIKKQGHAKRLSFKYPVYHVVSFYRH